MFGLFMMIGVLISGQHALGHPFILQIILYLYTTDDTISLQLDHILSFKIDHNVLLKFAPK